MKKPILKVVIEKDVLENPVILDFRTLDEVDSLINTLENGKKEFSERLNRYYAYKENKRNRKRENKVNNENIRDCSGTLDKQTKSSIDEIKKNIKDIRENMEGSMEYHLLKPMIDFIEASILLLEKDKNN